MPSSRTPLCPTPADRTRNGRWYARRIKGRIRSAMFGRYRLCEWWLSTSFAPSRIPSMMKRAPTCCSPPHTPAWDSGTRACICRTECRIRCRAPCYVSDHPLVPHGFSVILNAPAVFRFTASSNPERHMQAAEALGLDNSHCNKEDAGRILSDRITWFMQRLKTPNGLREIGYTSADIPKLVEGTLPQHRVTKLSPRPAGSDELSALFEAARSEEHTSELQSPENLVCRLLLA